MAKAQKKKKPKVRDISLFEKNVSNGKGAANISDAIIVNAEKNAKVITDSAKSNVDDNISGEMEKARLYCEKVVREAETASAELVRHRIMLAEMDVKKYMLKDRQNIIDRAYADAERGIISLPDGKYSELFESVIKKYAEDGDEVIICAADNKRLTGDWLKKAADKAKKKIKFYREYGTFSGGIILRAEGYDKNFTLSSIIGELRTQTEGKVSKILFTEGV